MDDSPQPAERAGADIPDASFQALPEDRELSRTDRVLVLFIIALVLVAVALILRTTVLLIGQDFLALARLAVQAGRPPALLRPTGLEALLVIIVGLPLTTLIHESAHALGGRLVGFWLEAIQVGVVKLTRTRKGLRLGFAKQRWWLGGSTLSYPVEGGNLRLRYAVFVALGPLSGLVLGFVCAELAHVTLAASSPNLSAVALLQFYSLVGVLDFLTNSIPYKFGKARNDGWFLLQLLRGTRAMERTLAFAILRGYTVREVPQSKRSPAVYARALALATTREERHVAAVYAYSRAVPAGDLDTAGHMIDQAVATAPPSGLTATLAHEVAYFEARYRGRPAEARALLARAEDDRFASFMRPRALAAIALAEGRYAEAREQAAEGLVAREAYAHTSGRRYRDEEQQLRAMLADAERALGEQSASLPAGPDTATKG
jgi:hypothetical protein